MHALYYYINFILEEDQYRQIIFSINFNKRFNLK